MVQQIRDIDGVIASFGCFGYVADRSLATAVYLLVQLGKPLLIEGHAGVGKTEVAKVLASLLETELIRLQLPQRHRSAKNDQTKHWSRRGAYRTVLQRTPATTKQVGYSSGTDWT
jgi:energy-coupling factor transporter ATP-binding protein EcfA2